MFQRIARRLPWIALGAAGGFYLDPQRGDHRRRELAARVTRWARGGDGSGGDGGGAPKSAAREAVSVDEAAASADDRVRARAAEPLAEETAAGVPSPAPTAMAERILEESEARVLGRPH